MEIRVECADRNGACEKPVRLGFDGRTVQVAELLDRWPGRGYCYFKVMGDDGAIYILRREEARAAWELTLFERRPTGGAALIRGCPPTTLPILDLHQFPLSLVGQK